MYYPLVGVVIAAAEAHWPVTHVRGRRLRMYGCSHSSAKRWRKTHRIELAVAPQPACARRARQPGSPGSPGRRPWVLSWLTALVALIFIILFIIITYVTARPIVEVIVARYAEAILFVERPIGFGLSPPALFTCGRGHGAAAAAAAAGVRRLLVRRRSLQGFIRALQAFEGGLGLPRVVAVRVQQEAQPLVSLLDSVRAARLRLAQTEDCEVGMCLQDTRRLCSGGEPSPKSLR